MCSPCQGEYLLIIYCIFSEYRSGFSFIFDRGSVFPLSSMSKGEKDTVVKMSNCQNAESCHQCQRGRLLASSLFGVLSVLSLMSTENGEKERRNRETKV
jgi:hypothetical protein